MCAGGTFGQLSVEVRTVGGGETWDSFLVATPGGSNETVAGALGNRDDSMQALVGRDYQQLQETLHFDVRSYFTCIVAINEWLELMKILM